MKLYLTGFVLLLAAAGLLLVSGLTRSLGTGYSWASIVCSVAAAAFAIAGVVRASR